MAADENDHLRPLGRVVVCAGRLEHAVYSVALAVGVSNPPAMPISKAFKAARRLFVSDPPPWATLTEREFDDWRQLATDALEERNLLFHGAQATRGEGNEWVRVHLQLRDGSDVPADAEAIDALADRLQEIWLGSPLPRLLPVVANGVSLHLLKAPGFDQEFSVFHDSKHGFPDRRPTQEDADSLLSGLSDEERTTWDDWLARAREDAS